MEQVAKLGSFRCGATSLSARRHLHAATYRSQHHLMWAHASVPPRAHSLGSTCAPRLKHFNQTERRSPALHAVQQDEAPTAHPDHTDPNADAGFLVDGAQLRELAQSKDSQLFDSSTFKNVFQLANALRVSLDCGLVTDASDMEKRAAAFGSNTLPAKQEVS